MFKRNCVMVVSKKWQKIIIQKGVQSQDHARHVMGNTQQHYIGKLERRER